MTSRYCQLIAWKLKFHERNPVFAGNLTINKENNNIQNLFNDNWNSYLQLSLDLFDYMEELLNLVQAIYTSLDKSRSNSMTAVGQCRLNPLIICIQDSSLLYDHIVKILFKLHEGVPNETLQDHRQRLADQFRRLKRFYAQSSTLQYFKNLIQVPNLPEVRHYTFHYLFICFSIESTEFQYSRRSKELSNRSCRCQYIIIGLITNDK